MKVAIIHLSDFHICENDKFIAQKTDGILSALNVLGTIDDFVIAFSGDLSRSGHVNEFKNSRRLFGKLINGIKQKNGSKYVNVFMVPGNHDLCLPPHARTRKDIQNHYDNNTIDELIPTEESYLENYYLYSNANGHKPNDIFLSRRYCTFGGYKIQFNLINTALFSTLDPDDKEIHYFPDSKIGLLTRATDVNLCVTVMHHSCEWFNWTCKTSLEKAIVDNSELLLHGHDHRDQTTSLSVDNSLDTWISAVGEMNFSSIEGDASFNAIIIDTKNNAFDGFSFAWDKAAKIYTHKKIASCKSLQNHSTKLFPLPGFVKSLKEDNFNMSEDFTEYFVFPKLVSESRSQSEKIVSVTTIEDLTQLLFEKKKLIISGSTNSGKTTLLKYIYCSLMKHNVPLLLSAETRQRIKIDRLVKHLFEEQYGDDPTLFERFEQLQPEHKILIVDGWDLLCFSKGQHDFLQKIEETFGYIILSVEHGHSNLVDEIKEDLRQSFPYFELHIKPFFTEKRNELVRNICLQKNAYNDSEINNVNKIIDNLVQNNSGLFSLNPAFIVRYTNCFIQDPYQDYTKGEAAFSKIFEFELNQSILKFVKRRDLDEIITVFEEIAGYMYRNKKDILPIEEVRTIIETYNNIYGEKVNVKDVITIGINSKVFRETDEMSIYFLNKNHLSYFVAKYLIRASQGDPADNSGIEYALENICFGINADVVLFISYLLNNTRILASIGFYAGELLQPWDALNCSQKNISLLHNAPVSLIAPPTEEEKKSYENSKERNEEEHYSEEIVEARGLFDYDDKDIDQYQYRIARAIKYVEIICKALPAFHSNLKLIQKRELVDLIYLYPRKIIFAMLRPVDINQDKICTDLLDYIEQENIVKKNGSNYLKKDVLQMLSNSVRAVMLGIFDYFAELATSPKSINILLEKKPLDVSEQLERLLFIENSGNTDRLVKEANSLLKDYRQTEYDTMIKLIVRKHLLTNKNLPFSKKQQIIDKVFGKEYRRAFLINKE